MSMSRSKDVYLLSTCRTIVVLLWCRHGMVRPNPVSLIAMFVTSWRFQFMHTFSASNKDFTKETSSKYVIWNFWSVQCAQKYRSEFLYLVSTPALCAKTLRSDGGLASLDWWRSGRFCGHAVCVRSILCQRTWVQPWLSGSVCHRASVQLPDRTSLDVTIATVPSDAMPEVWTRIRRVSVPMVASVLGKWLREIMSPWGMEEEWAASHPGV